MVEQVITSRALSWRVLFLETIQYRSCLYWLVYREVRMRYRNAILGFGWAVAQPIASVLVIAGFFQKAAGIQMPISQYAAVTACGIVPWLFFSKATLSSSQSFQSYAEILKKNYFPRVFVPFTYILANSLDLLVGLATLSVWFFFAGFINTVMQLLGVVVASVWLVIFTFSLSLWLSPVQVRFRDVAYASSFFLQGGFFISPVLFYQSQLTGYADVVMKLNPMYGIIQLFRISFLKLPIPLVDLAPGLVATGVCLGFGLWFFFHLEPELSDRL
jgi:lipopolysaccharide transport system permease protein